MELQYRHWGELNFSMLLDRHKIKMTMNISLYLLIVHLQFSYSLYISYMIINTEIHNWLKGREYCYWMIIPGMYSISPLKFRDHCRRGNIKSEGKIFRTYQRSNTYGFTVNAIPWKEINKPSQTKYTHDQKSSTHNSIHCFGTKENFNFSEEKSQFSLNM